MATIKVMPSGIEIKLEQGESVLRALKRNKIKIGSSCGGVASCGECMIKIIGSKTDLTPQIPEEIKLLGNVYFLTKERVSCQTFLEADDIVEIEVVH
jgi:ferredoxin